MAKGITIRQGEVVDNALALARDGGLAGLTVRRLAERMGFSEAALYRHFPNKQALLLAMIDRLSQERLLTPLREIAGRVDQPAATRLAAFVRHHVTNILAIDGLPVLILAEAAAANDEVLLARFRSIVGEVLSLIEGMVGEVPAEADRPSARAIGIALFGLSATAALHRRLFPGAAVEDEVRDRMPAWLVGRLLGEEP
jgi:TetR/AcrR family transcriptional regulator